MFCLDEIFCYYLWLRLTWVWLNHSVLLLFLGKSGGKPVTKCMTGTNVILE